MSTLKVTALKNPSSSANNIVLNTDGSISGSISSFDSISSSGTITANNLVIDDGGGVGPTVDIKGGGTSTDNPAANEQTLFLRTRNGTTSLSTGIGLWGTFENIPADTNARRAADLRAGFNGGAWGNEYISFHVGNGSGASNDAALMTTERVRITKDAMTANVAIEDTVGNVRTPRYTEGLTGASNHNLTNEGVYVVDGSSTFSQIIIGTGTSLTAGTIMTIYNNRSSSVTISRGSIPYMRNAADGDYTNYNTLTLGRNSVTTVTMFYNNLIILTGTDIS